MAPRTGTERAPKKGEVRRQKIIDVATRLFSRAGFHHASIADIADEVGITQAGVLYHFPNKPAILFAVLQDREMRNETRAETFGTDYLTGFVETLRQNETSPVLVQLFAVMSSESVFEDHPAHDFFVRRYDRLVRIITEALEPALDPARLVPGMSPETIARLFIAAADGLRQQWLLDRDAVDRPATMELLINILRPYLKDAATGTPTTRHAAQ